jgi:outer membrane murein-binding lipoprotein Lpp
MIRTWKTLAIAALLAALAPCLALAGETPNSNKEVLKKIDELRSMVEKLTTKVDTLRSDANADKAALDEIRDRIGALERRLATMPPGNKSFYPPPGAAGPPAAVGRVLLQNEFGAGVTLTLNNNTTLRIPAFQTGEVAAVPAGPLAYQVFVDGWGPGAVINTTLAPNQTLRLAVK